MPQRTRFGRSLRGIGIAVSFALTVVAGGLIGYKVGEKLGLSPIGLLVGLFFGFSGAVFGLYSRYAE